ncbi:MAG: SpoIIE family protein phosphatase [Bacteroidetes bacterium]|nr:SpoIIE family protein phosphatase [Bacteroidota bacterium]
MKNYLNPILLYCYLLFPILGLAQGSVNYSFRHLNHSNGFPAEFVQSMEFDSIGQLWALTDKGLMCYNGHSGKFYGVAADSSGLLPARPFYLYLDQQNKLWITYVDSYISLFDPVTETFTHFTHSKNDEQSFPDAMASSFYEDSAGNFWIGTWGGGLNLLDRATGKFTRYMPVAGDAHSLQTTNVTGITETADGTLILSTWEGDGYDNSLTLFNPETKTFSKFETAEYTFESEIEIQKIKDAFRIVHFVETDEQGNWWVGTYNGLFYVDHLQKTILRITGLDKNLLTSNGHITFDNVLGLLPENEHVLWFYTEVDGILMYDLEKKAVAYLRKNLYNHSSISGNIIRDVDKDPYGNIWVATRSGGLDVYFPNEGQVKIVSNDYLQASKMHNAQGLFAINYMIVSNTSPAIVVAHGNGISVYNSETGEVKRIEIREPFLKALAQNPALEKYNHNNPNFVGVVHEVKDGYAIGTYCGMVRYYTASGKLDFSTMELLEGFSPSAYNGENEILMLGAHKNVTDTNHTDVISSINKLDTRTLKEEPFLYLPTDIRTGEPDAYGVFEAIDSVNYYLRYNTNSFMIYNSEKNELKTYSYLQPYQNFPDSVIRLLHIDNFGISWLRTENGVYAFDYKTGETVNIQPDLNLGETDVVRCLARDQQGVLWIALNTDLIRYNPNTKETFRFDKRHDFDAGGFSDRFIRKHNREEVIIPANDGLLMFDPRRIIFHTRPPKMYISEIVIGKDTLSQQREQEFCVSKPSLMWNENFITIEFGSDLLYASGGKTYQYRLIGLDSSWISTSSQNKASYTNLQPGDYEFQVRCVDGYDNMSNTLSVPFFIDKPFWLKWWFILLEVAVGLGLIFGYITWRERNLKRAKIKLKEAVEIRTHQVNEKVHEIERQKGIIEVKNKELTDSINYAKGIQDSLLAHRDLLEANLPPHVIFFKPKDIVSGDFYWAAKTNDAFFLAICDSTGHGVPGAFMSLLNIRYLYEAVVEKKIESPNIVLDYVRMKLIENLAVDAAKDGMDGTLMRYDIEKRTITYSSAQNHPVLIRNGKATYQPADKMPIGGGFLTDPFQPHQIELQKNDMLYFFTDGYPDQFGGPKGGKLKHANLVNFLLTIAHLPVEEQLPQMEKHLDNWKGDLEQLDDILLFALKVEN